MFFYYNTTEKRFKGCIDTAVIDSAQTLQKWVLAFFYFQQFFLTAVAPDISVVGYDGDWYVGRENVQMTCKANANPPAHHFRWIRCVFLYL